jgi:hypothetical protein
MTLTFKKIEDIVTEAKQAAANEARAYVDQWTKTTGGNQYGEPMYCGFAWTNIYSYNGKNIDGRTKVGKLLKQAGVRQDYTGAFQIYNPSGWVGQSMDVKEAGARAAAEVFKKHGFDAYMGSRAD